jgi:hypothetical protein
MNTAKVNNQPASKVFLLLLCLLNIVVSKSNITAKAQGLILSEIAAGIIIAKNHHLLEFLDNQLTLF